MDRELSQMHPPDAAVALRSFARRYEEATRAAAGDLVEDDHVAEEDEGDDGDDGGPDDEVGVDELAGRISSRGRSVLDVVVDTARSLGVLDRALQQALYAEAPVIHADVLDGARRSFDQPHSGAFATEVELLAREASEMAARIDRTDPERWLRPVAVTGGGTTTPLDIVREAVRTARDHLEELRHILHEVRGRG